MHDFTDEHSKLKLINKPIYTQLYRHAAYIYKVAQFLHSLIKY